MVLIMRYIICFFSIFMSLKYLEMTKQIVEGDDDAAKKWFSCCSIARKYNSKDNIFKPGPNMDKWDWAGMSGTDIDKWRNNGCTEVVGGVNKPKCMLGKCVLS